MKHSSLMARGGSSRSLEGTSWTGFAIGYPGRVAGVMANNFLTEYISCVAALGGGQVKIRSNLSFGIVWIFLMIPNINSPPTISRGQAQTADVERWRLLRLHFRLFESSQA